jgi:hypothetical protein
MANVLQVFMQQGIVELHARGKSNSEIARAYGIDRRTVARYLRLVNAREHQNERPSTIGTEGQNERPTTGNPTDFAKFEQEVGVASAQNERPAAGRMPRWT